jgi:hypothetical protein
MQINANLNNVLATSLSTAINTRVENAERAIKTRRSSRKTAQTIGAKALESPSSDSRLLVSEWLSVHHNVALADDEYKPGPRRRKITPA